MPKSQVFPGQQSIGYQGLTFVDLSCSKSSGKLQLQKKNSHAFYFPWCAENQDIWLKRIEKIIIYIDFNHILSVYGLPVDLVCIYVARWKMK